MLLLQFAVLVNRGRTAGGRNDLIVFIQNLYIARVGVLIGCASVSGPKDVIAVQYRPTNVGARQRDGRQVFAVEGKPLEALMPPVGNEQGWVGLITGVDKYAVAAVEFIVYSRVVAFAAKVPDVPPFGVVLRNVIGPIAIGHVNVAIGRVDGCFGRGKLTGMSTDTTAAAATDSAAVAPADSAK